MNKPQVKGIVLKVFHMTPKKPNSALRKVALVSIKGLGNKIAYIPGENHTLTIHSEVLLIPKRIKDLVHVHFRILRGVRDSLHPIRIRSRSKYGTPRNV